MPTITDMQIQKNNKTRANVYIDGEFSFALEMITVMKLGLKIGQEVSQERLSEAIFDSERSVAFERAIDYLGRGIKTVKQITDYLAKKGYPSEVVSDVVQRLKDYRYLDDDAYAKLYVERSSATKGERRLKQELAQKGIDLTLAEQYSALSYDDSLENASRLAEKYMKNKPRDVKTLQKLQRYLISRGYSFEIINTVLRSFQLSDD